MKQSTIIKKSVINLSVCLLVHVLLRVYISILVSACLRLCVVFAVCLICLPESGTGDWEALARKLASGKLEAFSVGLARREFPPLEFPQSPLPENSILLASIPR